MSPYLKLLIGVAPVIGLLLNSTAVLFQLGFIRPFSVPTSTMAPTILPRDHLMMERLSLLRRPLSRGDVIVFRTEGIPTLPQDQFYVKRLAALPGEHVRISNGKLYINDTHATITSKIPEPTYQLPDPFQINANTDLIVPEATYYVLGDNGTNSLDSRSYGCVPAPNVLGRISFCYWPPRRIGLIR
jgi:signal peptidase I